MIPLFVFYIAAIAFIIRTIRMGLYYLFLWQLREYRRDRMIAHLRSPMGRKLLFGKMERIKWLAFILFIFSLPVIWLVWIGEAGVAIREWWVKGWLKPVFTIKALVLMVLVGFFALVVPLFSGTLFGFLLLAPFIDRLLFGMVSALVGVLGLGTAIWKRWMFSRATAKRRSLKNIRVIGVTGSFGKTTTKEYLATILSQRYRVIKTPESKNADIGIAAWILREMTDAADIAVIEMGVLRRGELQRICEMAQPEIGVITGIGNQHVELFGSVDALKQAKYELLQSLPREGIAVVNGKSEGARALAAWAKRDGLKQVIVSRSVTPMVHKDGVRFTLTHTRTPIVFTAPVLGIQAVENIVTAIETALALGMTMPQIQKGVAAITPVKQTMKPYKDARGNWYIDDTFNASEDGVRAALSYMQLFSGKKILVLTPLIELGHEGHAVHQRLGKIASEVCDLVLLTNDNYVNAFTAGVSGKKKHKTEVLVVSPSAAVKHLEALDEKNAVILFEGKEAGKVFHSLPDLHVV